VLFLPFHYGYWDDGHRHRRAANELTLTDWDPVSKQPIFKTAAASVRRVRWSRRGSSPAPTTTGSAPVGTAVPPTRGGPAALVTEDVAVETPPDGGGRR